MFLYVYVCPSIALYITLALLSLPVVKIIQNSLFQEISALKSTKDECQIASSRLQG